MRCCMRTSGSTVRKTIRTEIIIVTTKTLVSQTAKIVSHAGITPDTYKIYNKYR